jgi:hypothetical protein
MHKDLLIELVASNDCTMSMRTMPRSSFVDSGIAREPWWWYFGADRDNLGRMT